MVENLTPQLGDFFGAKGAKGVLVRSVEKGSVAAKSGLARRRRDCRVNGEPVTDVGDFSQALRSHKTGSASVGVIREKRNRPFHCLCRAQALGNVGREYGSPEVDADIDLAQIQTDIAKLEPQIQTRRSQCRPSRPRRNGGSP